MNIYVCVKPVPDPEKYNLLKIDPKTKRLVREGIPTVINPTDKNALEMALELKKEHGGKVIVLSMAPEFSRDRIVECLAMGADEGYLVSDRALGGADTLATSYTLWKAIEAIGEPADLVLLGNESADGATAQVSSQLGVWMNLPHLTNITDLKIDGNAAEVVRKADNGHVTFSVAMPAVFGVARGANKPRLITAMGIVKAKKKKLEVLNASHLDVEEARIGLGGSPTKAGELISPDMSRKTQELKGDPSELATEILAIIKKAMA